MAKRVLLHTVSGSRPLLAPKRKLRFQLGVRQLHDAPACVSAQHGFEMEALNPQHGPLLTSLVAV